MKKQLLAFLLMLATLLSSLPIGASAADLAFEDVPSDHWAYDYIYEMSSKGIVNGTGDGIFEPEARVTTAQFATMLVRAFYSDELEANTTSYDTWYGSAMHIALEKGLLVMNPTYYTYDVDASGNEVWYEPHANADMTRTYMAVMIYNYLKENIQLDPEWTYSKWIKENIPYDVAEVSRARHIGYSDTMIGFVYQLGILTGVDDKGTFDGNGYMTRAQACAVISRTLKAVSEGTKVEKCADINLNFYNDFHVDRRFTLVNGKAATPENITAAINDLRSKYVQGSAWTNDTKYYVKTEYDTIEFGGCAALVRMVCEDIYGTDLTNGDVFGNVGGLWQTSSFKYVDNGANFETMFDMLLPGDRLAGNGHEFVVLEVFDDYITIVEGNYNGTVNWDRKISRNDFNSSEYNVYRVVSYAQ